MLTNTVEYADRYMIGAFLGTAEVGIYWVFRGIANLVSQVAYFTVYEFRFPGLAASYQHQPEEFQKRAKQFLTAGVALAIAAALICAALLDPILQFVGRPLHAGERATFSLLLVGALLVSCSAGLTFVMNALRADRAILLATSAACATSVVGNIILLPRLGLRGAAVSFVLGMGVRTVVMAIVALRQMRSRARAPLESPVVPPVLAAIATAEPSELVR